ncbi:MAG TPA: stalk domain-containing protein [Syntrophomonadaceae bacterium]|nr:stalk domain-containing protein [Syntrophomonadaceae bacterium]
MYKNTLRKLTGVVLSLSLIIGLMLTMPLPASAGANWIRVTSGTTNALNSICYGNSKYVAVGDGGVILTSSNLSSWSKPSSGTVSDLLGVSTNGSGLFVAVGTNGKVVYSSNNGVNWAATSVSASNTTGCVSYGGGTFLAFFGADCYISTNGSSWTKKATVSSNINGLTYADGKFWAVSSSVSCSSDSGATWSGCGGGGTLNSVISNNATYLISVGNSGNGYMTFYSGSTFPKPTGYSYNYKGIGYGFIDGAIFFVMVGANGATGAIVTTETTASFEDKTVEYMPAGTPVLNAVCYGTTMFVAVGESGAILVSSGVSSPPVFTSGTTASCSENSAGTVYTATATPSNGTSCTYSLAGGVDDSLFNLVSSTGVLTFKSPPNYESPSDSGGNNVYNVIIRATDSMADADQNVAITVTNVNETPTVTSGTSVSVPENQTAAYTATADDPDGGTTITWSITGGADAALFTINGSTGAVTFKSAPNYESPGDSGGNNIYNITVKATDNGGLWDTGDVAITVTDAVDTPAATTGSASSVGAAGAVLSGTVNDNGGDTNVYFEYGATDSYGTSVSAATPSGGVISAGAGSTSVAVTLTGLSAGTPYHYRVKAVNSAGTTYGLDGTFTTIDIEITDFDAIPDVDAGYVGSATYANAAAVIAALPTTIKANGNTVTVDVDTWVETDIYDPNTAGSYTFTATLGTLPTGILNTGGYTATVEVVVSAKTEITGFDAIPNVDAGYTGSVAYADAAAVIAALPTTVKANGNTVTVPVTNWVDTDTYNPNVAGSYTFTAILGALPTGYLNTGGYTATVEVVVATKTEITGFDAIPNVDAGYTGSVAYADAAAVIAALPTTVKANGNTVTVDVDTWVETDIYDPNTVGSYTFTATLGALPTGYANAGSYTATVEVVVSAKTVLQSITAPAAITGVANGTAKTTTALGLPTTVILVTDQGNVSASVAWDVNSSTYVVSTTTEQTFTVNGTVTLPVGVVNTGNVSLLTSISVTVTGGGEGTISVTGVGLSKSALTLVVGGSTGTLTETVLPKNAANQNVTWESSNTTVATVSGGIVTPVAVGNATITVTTADGGKTASCTATVTVPVTATSGGTTTVDVTPVTITVPESVSEVKIAVSTTDELPLIEVNSSTSLGTVQMSIPEGTRVTGPAGWDGTIPLPTVVSEPSTAVSGAQTVNAVIEVGLDNETITFSKAVRLLIPGMAGKSAGYVRNGVFYSITQTLSADNQATGDSEIAYGAEAKIDSGADLAVWTKHFTEFVAYTPTASSRTSSSSISAPMVLTDAASSTASLSAVLNGEIRSRGGETITAYGVSYSTDKQTWTPVQAGSDNLLGSFSYTLRGLTANTEYYFKAYATNSEGTSYGDIKSFQVLPEQTASSRTVLRFQIGSKDYYVNDQLKSMDTAPIILEDRTLLPIRYVADALGATVSWDESKQKVTITFNGTTTELWIGKGTATVNGVSVPIDPDNPAVKPIIQSPGRSMLPLRFISQNLGCQVDWNAVSQEVKVTYPKA